MTDDDNSGPRMASEPIASEKVTIDRKVFFLDLKENQRGRFMKITEDVRRYAADLGVANEKALELGMEDKSREFREKGSEVYHTHTAKTP